MMDQVVQLRFLQFLAEGAGLRKLVHQRGEPPGETHGLPDTPQAALRVGVEPGGASGAAGGVLSGSSLVELDQGL